MSLKKLLTVLALASFAFTTFGALPIASAQVDSFSDLPEETRNFEAVDYLRDEGVVVGYEDGTYRPESNINRAEFLKIVMEVSGFDIEGGNCYPDVAEEWFAPYVCTATELGLVQGYDDGYFRPGQQINFAEASKIIVNTLEVESGDIDAELWFKHFVLALEDNAAIPETISAFDQLVNRGEMAEMIYRLDAEVTDKLSSTFVEVQEHVPADEVGETLRTFKTCEDLEAHMDIDDYYYDYGLGIEEADMAMPIMDSADGAAKSAAPAPAATAGAAGEADYSTTNVQVEGVDEADIVKTDGEYIYIAGDYNVRVVKAYRPTGMKEVSAIEFDDEDFYAEDMYVDGDRLVVLGYSYGDIVPYYSDAYVLPDYGYYGSVSRIYIFDIEDPENIEILRKVSFDGDYTSSRKVDDTVYVVLNRYNYYYNPIDVRPVAEDLVPAIVESEDASVEPMVDCDEVMYVPGGYSSEYLIVAGIPVDDADGEISREVILGSSGEVYASRDNLYVTEPKYYWYYWEYDDESETVIHKFNLNDGDVEYDTKGKVPGNILNQFSMDESDGHFRIATTTGNVWDSSSKNNVYVLDSNMETVGKLEGLAPGETIYSVRFMGDRGYLVTFKKVDPFFAIDLADPKNPKVLGKLKIPGYSDYLHPYDENHIIGVGKEAVDAGEERDFAWYQGMKIAMFDVTDVENPRELHKVEIGDRGTDSDLLWDHKALLFDKEKGIMAFPVTLAVIPEEVKNDPYASDSTYGDYIFQGAYIYDVSIENGFDLRGTITHYDEDEVADYSGYYWYGMDDIYRILYIGDYFYTVSGGMVKASNMSDLSEVNRVILEEYDYNDNFYWEDVIF